MGWTVLHNCAQNDAYDELKELMHWAETIHRMPWPKMVAWVNTANAEGGTALHLAAYRAHEKVVRMLLEKGADPAAVDGRGHTPAALAAKGNKTKNQALIEAKLAKMQS